MLSSNRSLIIATLLTGTAVASGTLMYGSLTTDDENLLVLDETLPSVVRNGLLPPPATFLMRVTPPEDIPGIRRLKIARPKVRGRGVESGRETDKDFYLTGTRSAELIRAPVEARIETFPTVTLEEAVEGALAVDEWGFQVVQSFLNQAMGDASELKLRMAALLEAIEDLAGDYDAGTISDAANVIIEASARAHYSAYMAPFVLADDFKLTDGAQGWDFGPKDQKPHSKFSRVSSESKMLVGDSAFDEGHQEGPSALTSGIRNVEQFVATGLKNGRYRVVILTATPPNGRTPLYPFGVDVKRNGGKLNMVDTRATDGDVPLMKLATDGPGRFGDVTSAQAAKKEAAAKEAAGNTTFNFIDGLTNSAHSAVDMSALDASAPILYASNSYSDYYGNDAGDLGKSLRLDGTISHFVQTSRAGDNSTIHTGHMLVTRAEVKDGTLTISFRQLSGQNTYVTAVIIYPEPDAGIEEELLVVVSEFLDRIVPTAGENLPQTVLEILRLPVIDVESAFADASDGLPTEEGVAATQEEEVVAETVAAPAPETTLEEEATEDLEVLAPAPEPTVTEPDPLPEPEPEPPVTEPEPPTTEPEPE
ncbi:MAG: hypothetical protein JKY60_16540, partial [Kordiimonadaceae bacterium]|nr:hypothetical protein [Kordiimonadaceae bacterium]